MQFALALLRDRMACFQTWRWQEVKVKSHFRIQLILNTFPTNKASLLKAEYIIKILSTYKCMGQPQVAVDFFILRHIKRSEIQTNSKHKEPIESPCFTNGQFQSHSRQQSEMHTKRKQIHCPRITTPKWAVSLLCFLPPWHYHWRLK